MSVFQHAAHGFPQLVKHLADFIVRHSSVHVVRANFASLAAFLVHQIPGLVILVDITGKIHMGCESHCKKEILQKNVKLRLFYRITASFFIRSIVTVRIAIAHFGSRNAHFARSTMEVMFRTIRAIKLIREIRAIHDSIADLVTFAQIPHFCHAA